ncbi:hypothetical protein D8674_008528 [Pyrus ussuriensis x Pyrus communis]|uniref:Myb/SANT-like DNA-binding domain-containing protein n=1 Tax=Pyrus ussuriensis x Pyrus communis TaxID=2448454 RepID=A0A5N5HTA7_9ROSA|nr:hypothetical protein D8674_008528 [Pyrus ussuriensis x Pyrus communis]
MEANGLFSGMLGLEMPLHQNTQNPQNPHHHMHQPQMVVYAPHHDPDNHQNPHQSVKQGHPFAPKSKQIALSDDDEPGFGADDNSNGDNKKKISPWQRMKWTDTMVRLLIMAVFYIGDDASDGPDPTGKKKPAGGLLQKKGKWKSVSRAMMEKGFYVSPQQCEDKFNDLNKRYKRVNDILGKGTACRVVENQGLLEKMDLAPKMKEEVRKLMNSKHLFFREMCAYHNSCGHGTVSGGSNGAHNSPPEVATEPSEIPVWPQPHEQLQQRRCFHSSENAQAVANSGRSETEGSKVIKGGSEDEDEDYEDDDSDDEVVRGGSKGHMGHENHEDNDDNDERAPQKVPRKEGCFSGSSSSTQLMQQLNCEARVVLQDVSKTAWEKKQWLKTRMIQLEEQQVSYQHRAFELEKQRLMWIKYSGKKERYMERGKLENERRRLENERMLLVVRGNELELLELHHQQQQQNSSNKRSDPSSPTG